jgi:hypothetical protein
MFTSQEDITMTTLIPATLRLFRSIDWYQQVIDGVATSTPMSDIVYVERPYSAKLDYYAFLAELADFAEAHPDDDINLSLDGELMLLERDHGHCQVAF